MTDLNDSLDDLLGGPMTTSSAPRLRAAPPASYQPKDFSEPCAKCRGTGKFISYTGRTVGECFACKGAGQRTFKSSPEQRERNRENAAARKGAATEAWVHEHKAEVEWLAAAALRNAQRGGTFGFPQSLIDAIAKYGSLTDNQLDSVRRLMARDIQRNTERAASRPAPVEVDVSKLENAFATARERANRPNQQGVFIKAIKLQSGDLTVAFQPGSEGSKWEGMIFAKNIDGKKLGSIKDGRFQRRFECTDVEAAAVVDCASDPEKAAVAYGKAFSSCGICGRLLLNDESIARGIGPICAERFGW
jgi:hypothetical protein